MDYKGYKIEEISLGRFYIYQSYDEWLHGMDPRHTASSLPEAKEWVDSGSQVIIQDILPSPPNPSSPPISRIVSLRNLYAQNGIQVGDSVTLYHFTRKESVKNILTNGLIPRASAGLGGIYGRSTLPGIYLTRSREASLTLLEDYDMREERVPGVFSLLEIVLPSDWPMTRDEEVLYDYKNLPAVITNKAILPSMIRLVEEDLFTVSPIGAYREFPGYMARITDRVRLMQGEHAGEEGIIKAFTSVVDRKVIWSIDLDSGVNIQAKEDEIIALIK